MSQHLSIGQRALLEAELQARLHQLDRRVAEHDGGLSRAEHAHEVLGQDANDPAQREEQRELDMALSDLELRELGEVSQALARLRDQSYGHCVDCDADIPFERLRAEPQALRCLACEGLREAALRRRG